MEKPKDSLRKDIDFLISHILKWHSQLHEFSLGKVTFDFHLLVLPKLTVFVSKEVAWCIDISFDQVEIPTGLF